MVTLDWSKVKFQRGQQAHDEYQVTGFQSINFNQACAMVPAQRNSTHRWDLLMVAQEPYLIETTPTIVRVGVDYLPISVAQKQPQEVNPLNEPIRYRWQQGNIGDSIDRDADGKPILNSAGGAFNEPITGNVATLFLEALRNERTYGPGIAYAYQNRLNSTTFFGWPEGTVRINSIAPASSYKLTDPFVPVIYSFEFRDDGWDHRILDQGYNGWWDDNGTKKSGRFEHANGQACALPVLLNGRGKPLDTTLKIWAGKTPVEVGPPKGVKKTETTSEGVFLYYSEFKSTAFTELGIEE